MMFGAKRVPVILSSNYGYCLSWCPFMQWTFMLSNFKIKFMTISFTTKTYWIDVDIREQYCKALELDISQKVYVDRPPSICPTPCMLKPGSTQWPFEKTLAKSQILGYKPIIGSLILSELKCRK